MNTNISYGLHLKLQIIKELGQTLTPESTIMDFGCGSGKNVQELRGLGYSAFGCDIKFRSDKNTDTESMKNEGIIRLIDMNEYRLPFKDGLFDFVFSDQVFEHVQNYAETISEIRRVLKPDGFCLHIFPSRYKLIETHIKIPLSSIIQSYPWLYFWALAGIRNEFQSKLPARKVATLDYDYLRKSTNYLSKKQLTKEFKAYFNELIFCEKMFLKCSRRGKFLYGLSKVLPFIPALYSTFRSRVVFIRPRKSVDTTGHS